jgi:hypothetical protein
MQPLSGSHFQKLFTMWRDQPQDHFSCGSRTVRAATVRKLALLQTGSCGGYEISEELD